jgi:conjugal transfer pilus assembly protein TraF
MSRALLLVLWVLTAIAAPTANAQDANPRYWSDTWRGWHFYEDPEPEATTQRDVPRRSSPSTPKPQPAKLPEIVEFERLQKAVEQTRTIAIMRPTEANVRRYMELEAKVVARASTFADMAQRVAWATPELDPTLQGRPVNAKALEVFEQQQISQRSESIGALGRDHVLFFFFRGDCPYCHAFAPTLEAFQARHGIKVVAISMDGGPMPGFADARRDNGIATTLKVSQVPAIYLAQPFTGKITPIGFGVLSEAQLLERITIVSSQVAELPSPISTSQAALR